MPARLARAQRWSAGSRRRSRRNIAAASSRRTRRRSARESPCRHRRKGRFSTRPHGSTPSKPSSTVGEPTATPSSKWWSASTGMCERFAFAEQGVRVETAKVAAASIRTDDTSPERYGCRACVHCFLGVTLMIEPGISSRTAVRSVTSRAELSSLQRSAFDLQAATTRSIGLPTTMSSPSTLCGRAASAPTLQPAQGRATLDNAQRGARRRSPSKTPRPRD